MSDPFFFARAAATTLAEIIALTGARVAGGADFSAPISGGASPEEAEPGELTWFSPSHGREIGATRASACFVEPRHEARVGAGAIALVIDDPYAAFAAALTHLFPDANLSVPIFAAAGLNPGASIHPEARLEPGVVVDPGAVIGPRCEIGAGTVIAANSVIGAGVRIGRDCSIGGQVAITHALVGDRVSIHQGARIGQAGLHCDGTFPSAGRVRPAKAPQVGRVIVQDDVEIGANAALDRGAARDTIVGEGSRIGNLVQISSSVMVGRGCLIFALASVGKGARLGDFVVVEGQARIAAGLRIGKGARIAAQSGVASDLAPGARFTGTPTPD